MNKLLITLSVAAALSGASLTSVSADEVITDDLIVQGSACIGADCVENMDFGFSTLVLDQADPSITFRDTSVGSFPSTDWRVGMETSSGTFSIGNVTAGETVFAVSNDGNAISIGSEAVLSDGAISVGGMRIANAGDGIADTDAVTLRQLNAAISALPTDLIAENAAFAEINARNAQELSELSDEINVVGAIGSAMSALQINPRATGQHFLSVGFGQYEGASAIAIGSFHFFADDSVFVNAGISAAPNGSGGTAARLGMTFGQ